MKVIFLGTNGWYDTETGNTICILIEADDCFIILDAGNGIYKVDQYIRSKKPIYLFLSHFHLDHIVGLHILNKFNFSQGMHIYGQIGTKDVLDTIINEPYTVPIAKLSFELEVYELSEGAHNIPFAVKCKFLLHSSKCMGYRFELDGKILTYIPDTGICKNAIELAENADLLITECSFKIGQRNVEWRHLNPEEAAKIANEAGTKKLVLTHFDASTYQTLQKRKEAQKKQQRYLIMYLQYLMICRLKYSQYKGSTVFPKISNCQMRKESPMNRKNEKRFRRDRKETGGSWLKMGMIK